MKYQNIFISAVLAVFIAMYINAEIVSGYYKDSYKLSRMYGYRGIWYRGKQNSVKNS